MKKLIFLCLLFASCGYAAIDGRHDIIINKIERRNNELSYSWYYGKGTDLNMVGMAYNFQFLDSTGKFNVGDTIRLVKQ